MFKGTYTALITPFKKDESIDWESLERLIHTQIESGIDGLVILGTTGESPTISPEEHKAVIRFAVKTANKKTKIIAGTGSNCTREAIEYSTAAEKDGADALLLVNPYYNKPTQKGLKEHFRAIAEAVTLPIILYNIPGRCAVNTELSTLLELAEISNIVGVKEASGDLAQIESVIAETPEDFIVLSGDDNLTAKILKMGGDGVISVLSNILPKEVKSLVDAGLAKNWEAMESIDESLQALFAACFIETNPQPIKTLLAAEGVCEEVFRLPMTTMLPENKEKLLNIWEAYKKS